MSETKTERRAKYKGRTYKLHFLGNTKFGRRAKLSFLDGSKEFWVAADQVTEIDAGTSTSASAASSPRGSGKRGPECPCCGKSRRLILDYEDGLKKCFECCDMPSE